MRKLEQNEMDKIRPLVEGWQESMIWSCLQGCMGVAYTKDERNPASVAITIANFTFFAGKPDRDVVRHKPVECTKDFMVMVPKDDSWNPLIEEVYGEQAKKVERYAIKKEPGVFDKEQLQKIAEREIEGFSFQMIDELVFHQTKDETVLAGWNELADLTGQFNNYEEFRKNGLGAVAIHNGVPVAGASSYTYYNEGIEVEIDTKEEFRRRGLARICGAKLILACMSENKYPSWDAQNKTSVALAEQLGYHFDKSYTAYQLEQWKGIK